MHTLRLSSFSRAARIASSILAILAALFASLVLAREAAAHPLDLGYLRLDAQPGSVAAGLDLDLTATAHILAVDESALAADAGAALTRHAAALADATVRRRALTSDLGACTWQPGAFASLAARTVTITVRAECPPAARELRWALPFLAESRVSPTFQLLVKAHVAAQTLVTTLDRNLVDLTLPLDGAASASWGFGDFVWSGVEHIGAAPDQWHDSTGWKLPDGLDHVLFLLALLLAGGRVLTLVGITSGFTLGHSITLALSVLGVVRPPAELIEPLIALSIALVAAEAIAGTFVARPRQDDRRWMMATAFGLVHGFGFAGALNELGLTASDTAKALVGYNLGVELGQIAIVLVLAPLILLLARRPLAHRVLVRALSAAIFVAGLYWFAQRIIESM